MGPGPDRAGRRRGADPAAPWTGGTAGNPGRRRRRRRELVVALVARCMIGTVFAVAVLGKLAGPGRWRAFVASLQPLWPRPGRPALAVVAVAAEATAAALLVPAGTARYGLVLAALVLSVFAAVIAVSRRR